jgi:hypothetical protein
MVAYYQSEALHFIAGESTFGTREVNREHFTLAMENLGFL